MISKLEKYLKIVILKMHLLMARRRRKITWTCRGALGAPRAVPWCCVTSAPPPTTPSVWTQSQIWARAMCVKTASLVSCFFFLHYYWQIWTVKPLYKLKCLCGGKGCVCEDCVIDEPFDVFPHLALWCIKAMFVFGGGKRFIYLV